MFVWQTWHLLFIYGIPFSVLKARWQIVAATGPQYKAHQPYKDLTLNFIRCHDSGVLFGTLNERMKIEVGEENMLLQLIIQNAIGRDILVVISEIIDDFESF